MKKIIIALAVLTLVLTAFAACGSKNGHKVTSSGNTESIADTGSNISTASELTSEEKEAWGEVSIDMGGDSQASSTVGGASTSTPNNSTPSGSGTSSISGSGTSSNAGSSSSSGNSSNAGSSSSSGNSSNAGSSSSSASSGGSASSGTSSSSQTSDKDQGFNSWIPF